MQSLFKLLFLLVSFGSSFCEIRNTMISPSTTHINLPAISPATAREHRGSRIITKNDSLILADTIGEILKKH